MKWPNSPQQTLSRPGSSPLWYQNPLNDKAIQYKYKVEREVGHAGSARFSVRKTVVRFATVSGLPDGVRCENVDAAILHFGQA